MTGVQTCALPILHGLNVARGQLDRPFIVRQRPLGLTQVVVAVAPLVESLGKQGFLDQEVGKLPDRVFWLAQAQLGQPQVEAAFCFGRFIFQD